MLTMMLAAVTAVASAPADYSKDANWLCRPGRRDACSTESLDATQVDAAVEAARRLSSPVGVTGQRDWDVAVVDAQRIVMTPTRSGLDQALDDALDTAREVVARRIDPTGTAEATVVRQGATRILVQVPGLQDPEGLKALLGKTAKLEFKLVDFNADPVEVAKGNAAPGSQVVPYPDNR